MDRYQTGALAGLIAANIMILANAVYEGPPLFTIPALVLCGEERSFLWYVFGYAMHLAIGVGYGILFAHIKPYKAKYTWLRALTFGFGTWFVEFIISMIFSVQSLLGLSASQKLTLLAPHLLFGITLAYLLPWCALLTSDSGT